jgi:hypothetical protein
VWRKLIVNKANTKERRVPSSITGDEKKEETPL